MNTLIVAAIRCFLMFLLPAVAYAVSAQWDLDPISGDWNTAANWTPMGVPNGPADIATFALSNTTNVSISANTEVNGITFTAAATNPYTITASAPFTLVISGTGVTNNSGSTQHFITTVGANGEFGLIVFSDSATAGTSTMFTNNGGTVSGGTGGSTVFHGSSNVNRGALQVDGSITSNTFVTHRGTLAGTGTVDGNVVNNDFGTVRPGGVLGAPGVLTVVHNYTQTQYATLIIQIAGASPDQFSVLNVLGNANLTGFLDPMLLNGFVPTIGQTFTFLNYASLTGEFSHIKHRVFDNGLLQWSVIYEPNHAIL